MIKPRRPSPGPPGPQVPRPALAESPSVRIKEHSLESLPPERHRRLRGFPVVCYIFDYQRADNPTRKSNFPIGFFCTTALHDGFQDMIHEIQQRQCWWYASTETYRNWAKETCDAMMPWHAIFPSGRAVLRISSYHTIRDEYGWIMSCCACRNHVSNTSKEAKLQNRPGPAPIVEHQGIHCVSWRISIFCRDLF